MTRLRIGRELRGVSLAGVAREMSGEANPGAGLKQGGTLGKVVRGLG